MRVSRKWLYLSLALFLATEASAEGLDLSLGIPVRSYPLSGVLEVESGYGLSLWGTPRGPFGGYLRPRLLGATALTYNSLDAGIEFFPLGIFGLRAGIETIQNDRAYSAYDCADNLCTGRFQRHYLGVEATVGEGKFFARLRLRRDFWRFGDGRALDPVAFPGGGFIEPTSGLRLAAGGEGQNILRLYAGLKIDPRWTALAALLTVSSDHGGFSRSPMAVLVYSRADKGWSVGGGLGTFESSLKPWSLTATLFARWEIWPSLALDGA